MKERNTATHGSAYTPNMDTPERTRRSNRALGGLLLTLLLPPIGIAYLWRRGVFRTRGRVLLSCVATIEMAVLLALLLPTAELPQEAPMAHLPVAVTIAPDDGIVTALSNIDQLLAQQQAADAAAAATEVPLTDEEAEAQHAAEQEAILNTIVYSVYSNAKYYHAAEICGTQSNRRALTIREAMNEGMGACKNCNPPVYTG
ncbi:MAG: hypothetical protein Q4G06_03300 [Clostridia bacterium]|nr:hypothetical protein [Clostridia bacterium]